jgi:hypothetical protein
LVRLAGPGGLRSVVAESALLRHQLLILNRGRKRAPNLHATDRIAAGLLTLFVSPARRPGGSTWVRQRSEPHRPRDWMSVSRLHSPTFVAATVCRASASALRRVGVSRWKVAMSAAP